MRSNGRRWGIAISLLLLVSTAAATPPRAEEPTLAEIPTFKPLSPADGHHTPYVMIPDILPSPADFSAMPIVRLPTKGAVAKRRLLCSATLIGPRVLLTAAHCVSPKGEVLTVYRALVSKSPLASLIDGDDQQPNAIVKAACTPHPLFASGRNTTADFALCLLEDLVTEVPAEWITTNPSLLLAVERMHLAGFGCQNVKDRKKPLEGDNIKYAASQHARMPLGVRFVAGPQNDNYLALVYARVQPTICEGDSGGVGIVNIDGQFGPDNRATKQIGKRRAIIAVNSGYVAENEGVALVATLASPDFRDFLLWWRNEYRLPLVCDLDTRSPDMRRACRPLD